MKGIATMHGFEPGEYVHLKSKAYYDAVCLAQCQTNGQEHTTMVVYYRLGIPEKMFVREVREFMQKFKRKEDS
jgi:hypothetical protein